MTDTHYLTRRTRAWEPGRDGLRNQGHLDTDRPAHDCDPSALARVPDHIEVALQARAIHQGYAHPSTVNHQRWHDEHCRYMATGAAPGVPIPRRRRIPQWLRTDLETLAATAVILALVVLVYWLLSNLPRIAVA